MLYADTYMTHAAVPSGDAGSPARGLARGQAERGLGLLRHAHVPLAGRSGDRVGRGSSADAGGKAKPPEVARLKASFHGSMVLLYGETTKKSGKYRVLIDGKLIEHLSKDKKQMLKEFDAGEFASMVGGNAHYNQVIAQGLAADVEHTLEIQPIFADAAEQELRLESICVAGGKACVRIISPGKNP